MKKLFLVCLIFLFGMIGTTNATVLTFDDIPYVINDRFGTIYRDYDYNGFNISAIDDTWGALSFMDWIDTVDPVNHNWDYGAISGEFTMLNNNGGSAIITSATDEYFTFDGLYARMWSNPSYDREVEIIGYKDNVEILTLNYKLYQNWLYFDGIENITFDKLRIKFGNFFLIDDLSLTKINNSLNSVPEPSTLILFITCLLSLSITTIMKKKRKK